VTSTLSSLSSPADASRHSQAFKTLVEIIFTGGDERPQKLGMLSLGTATDPMQWLSKSMPLPSATAHAILLRGVPSRSLPLLGEYLGIGKGVLADLVGMDRATVSRKVASNQPLPLHAAERVLRLLELQCQAEDTFESPAAASAWLRHGHEMLGGESPLEWVQSCFGAQRVKELLVALKYGGVV
jgi:putative toxin-antitoxin system antitoxin component (TIGR02293 family)